MILATLLLGAALQAPAPDCPALLTAFATRIATNYAGVRLELHGARRNAHDAMQEALLREAAGARDDACFSVLDRYVRWFADPHLFVFQSTRLDTAETTRRAQAQRVTTITEASARAYYSARGTALDPIEGIWYDGEGLRVAVVPDSSARDAGRFTVVVLTSDTTAWRVGAERGRAQRTADGAYALTLATRNFAERRHEGTLHKEVILRLSPGVWAKEFPAPPPDGLVDATDPRRPTLVTRGSTVIVSMVSHDPRYTRVLDSLVRANDDALRAAERLLIDLRGNEGGSSTASNRLLPFLRSRDERSHAYTSGPAVMLSSPDQIAYARTAFGSDTTAFVRDLVQRLTAAPGEFVELPAPPRRPFVDTTTPGARRVAILVDAGTVSAAEVLVLAGLRSTRVQVFGEPTAGALDYQSVSIVRVLPDESRWLLGYPTITASARLPEGGMRGRGITPDVRVETRPLRGMIDDVEQRMR